MIAIKLAFRNLVGAGLRTWLNVSILSFAFVVIVFYNGMLDGWNRQAYTDTMAWEAGYGQLWHPTYDPFDAYSIQDAHARYGEDLQQLESAGQATPLLLVQATIYPQGRMQNVLLKGIVPGQKIILIPSDSLKAEDGTIPAVIGKRMAANARLKQNDRVLLRWRDKNGTFDAREILIKGVFSSNVPTIDNNQIWLPLADLQKMTGLEGEATLFVTSKNFDKKPVDKWVYRDLSYLLSDIDALIRSKKAGSSIIYGLLLVIALLAIFDTQVLSIFRRQKEIGTYIALGMTRWRVIRIFTIEGSANSILAILLGSAYGIPLFAFLQKNGIPMPRSADGYGLTIADKIIPVFSIGMILSTVVLVILSATIVSYFPTRKIAKMRPTDALKGKIL